MKMLAAALAAPLVATLLAAPSAAQERPIEEVDLPRHVAEEVVRFFNDPGTIRFSGATTVPATRVLIGQVGVLDGPVRLAGEIDGGLIVVNGDLELQRGATITGDVTVLGGTVSGAEEAFIGGTLTVYEERLRYLRRGDEITYTGPRQPPGPSRDTRFGRSHFTLRTGTNYNRVEGLPVMFGPIIETAGLNPLRIEGFGIWRSTSGLRLVGEELGYSVLVEQRLFARPDAGIGFTMKSEVLPIERWGLNDAEASLSTFLLRRDYRDYYESRGWSGFVRSGIPATPLSVLLEYREEEHRFAQLGAPWSLSGGDDPWRPQPLVGEGRTRSIGAEIGFDSRNEARQPSSGWLIRASTRIGVGGSLELPVHFIQPAGSPILDVPARELDHRYETGLLDLRRYNRVSPTSRLSMRLLAGGSLSGNALPPQFQHALGGEGSLPGHRRFAGDCGARAQEGRVAATVRSGENRGEPVIVSTYGAFGCDRVALLQMEYQGTFGVTRHRGGGRRGGVAEGEEWDWSPFIDFRPSWSVFFDAGRGWALPERPGAGAPALQRDDSETMMDLGVGVFMGAIGLYWAMPVDGGDRGVNFFVRLSQRF